MTNTPTFSVIVPAYNVADYIEHTLLSVLDQDYTDFELIVIDDGSTDTTAAICRRLVHDDKRIKYLHQQNTGPSAARNRGIERARGTYLILLDSDDSLLPGTLSIIAQHIVNRPDIIRFQVQDSYPDGRVVPHLEQPFTSTNGPQAFRHFLSYYYIDNAWCYCYRTAFFKQQRFTYTQGCLAEDFGLTPLIIASAQSVESIAHIGYNYHQRPGSIMHDSTKLQARVQDAFTQLSPLVSAISRIPDTAHITHYLVMSFLTFAAQLPYRQFIKFYRQFQESGLAHYIHPSTLRAWPRAMLAKSSPRLFYFFISRHIL